jgi:hypothetical protein
MIPHVAFVLLWQFVTLGRTFLMSLSISSLLIYLDAILYSICLKHAHLRSVNNEFVYVMPSYLLAEC